MREALSLRVDGAEEVKKEMREDIAEDKRKLKVWPLLPPLALFVGLQYICNCKAVVQTASLCAQGRGIGGAASNGRVTFLSAD